MARVCAVSDPDGVRDPGYLVGLRGAVSAALAYGIAAIGHHERLGPVPDELLLQARLAARSGVSLDTVLRRYIAGHALLADFILRESAARELLNGRELQDALRAVAAVFDDIVAAVSRAYGEEMHSHFETPERRQGAKVKRLLAGELVSGRELEYELEAWHLACIASGPGAIESLRELASALQRSLLSVCLVPGEAWAWLGGKDRLATPGVLVLAKQILPEEMSLVLGEPGYGVEGWRFSHRQAKAAMLVGRYGSERKLRYADSALLASALSDDVLAGSLHDIYIAPLEKERDKGVALVETLGAYFAVGGNISSTAAALGVSRQTVNSRLRLAEERFGCPLDTCAAEVQIAMRLHQLEPAIGQAS
jgi:hypothetical protein